MTRAVFFAPPRRRLKLIASFCAVAGQFALHAIAAANPPGLLLKEAIFETAPFPQCHASTMVETSHGLLAAFWGGSREGQPDVDVWTARKLDGTWSAPVRVASGAETEQPRVATHLPVLFQVPGGPLLLFYKTGDWWAYVKSSTDDGYTWSKPTRLYNSLFGPVKNKPVVARDGAILAGASVELPNATSGAWRVHFERSVNGGRSWQFIGPVNDGVGIAAIQPALLLHPDHRVQAIGRTKQGRLFEIWSGDDGKSWGEMTLTELPNPNSGIDAVTLRDGRQLLVYNHSTVAPGTTKGIRAPLNIAVSRDGRRWQAALVLEPLDESARATEPQYQFSYPAVIQTSDSLVHVTYTWHRRHIEHVVLDPARFELRDIVKGQWPE